MADVLQLEIQADNAGWSRIVPPVLVGTSGVSHRFSALARKGRSLSAFDVLQEVGEKEVLGAYIQAIDTRACVVLVSSSGTVSRDARRLAGEYGVRVILPREIPSYFKETVPSPRCGKPRPDPASG